MAFWLTPGGAIMASFEDDTWPEAWNHTTDTNEFVRNTTYVLDGTYSIENDPTVFEEIFSPVNNGLYQYPGYPCKLRYYHRHQNTPGSNRFHFGVGHDTSGDGIFNTGLRVGGNADDHKHYLQENLDDGTGWNQIGSKAYASTGTASQWYAHDFIVDDGTFLSSGSYVVGHRLYEYDASADSTTLLDEQQATFDSSLVSGDFGLYFSVGSGYVLTNWDQYEDITNQ